MGPNAKPSEDMMISTDSSVWQAGFKRAGSICI